MNMLSNRVEYKDRLLSYQINWPLPAFRYFLAVGSAPGEGREETSQILFPSIWSHRAGMAPTWGHASSDSIREVPAPQG